MALKLPQNVTGDELETRNSKLNEMRSKYSYSWFGGLIPANSKGPDRQLDVVGPNWFRTVFQTFYRVRANLDRSIERVISRKEYKFLKAIEVRPPAQLAEQILTLKTGELTDYYAHDPMALTKKDGSPITQDELNRATLLQDYKDLFQITSLSDDEQGSPEASGAVNDVAEVYRRHPSLADESFSRSFIAGANPDRIRLLNELPEGFDSSMTLADLGPSFSGDSLGKAIADRRAFIVDYSEFKDMLPGKYRTSAKDEELQYIEKYVYGAKGVFVVAPGTRKDFSVAAIEIADQNTRRVLRPSAKWEWLIAKAMLNASHYTQHEVVSHLGLTHLVIEPIVVSSRRQLATNHPIYHLLNPHFEGTRAINSLALASLIQPDKAVDRLIGCQLRNEDLSGSQENTAYGLLEKERMSYVFSDNYPNRKFSRNGTDSRSIAEYPYRDDSLKIWEAINAWVIDYVNTFYDTDADVVADTEVQAWAAEVSDPSQEGGGLKGFGSNSAVNFSSNNPSQSERIRTYQSSARIASKTDLAEICSMIIYTAGAQHAAVNFTQKTDMIFLPAAPLSGYLSSTEFISKLDQNTVTKEDYIKMLPPLDVAIVQVNMLEFLGGVQYSSLGSYTRPPFSSYFTLAGDKTATLEAANQKFLDALARVESEINAANSNGRVRYEALLPSRIPQSINI